MLNLQTAADAIFEGVRAGLLAVESFAAFRQICPIHGELYQVELAPGKGRRCARCLEALREDHWPTSEPTKGATR